MAKQIKWLDRTFQFGWTPAYLPIYLNRLIGTIPRIQFWVREVPNDLLIYKPKGTWSVKEHIGHLIDLETLHHDRIIQLQAMKEVLSPADMSNQTTEQADHNQRSVDDLIQSFRQARTHFIRAVRSLNNEQLQHAGFHKRLGDMMNPVDVCFFCAEHDDHHLAIIQHLTETQR